MSPQFGYVRVSTVDQNTDRQLDGIELDQIFTEKISGKSIDRPALQQCLSHLRTGDTLHVHSMDRLARNLKDLQQIVEDLTSKGVVVKFHKENLIFTNDTNPMSKLMLQVMGAVAEFERSLIKERQMEGIQKAKARGVYTGRKPSLTDIQIQQIKEKKQQGLNPTQLSKKYGVSRATIYNVLKKVG